MARSQRLRHSHLHVHKDAFSGIVRPDADLVSSLIKRQTNAGFGGPVSTQTCGPGADEVCVLPTSSSTSTTIPLALGVAIPLVVCFGAILFFWRKNKKKMRAEDAADKHHSLDFGLGEISRRTPNGKNPEMSVTTINAQTLLGHKQRGMSMDMGSPYILPGEANSSRASFNSLSRSAHDGEDPYRPVTFVKSESPSMGGFSGSRPPSRKDSGVERSRSGSTSSSKPTFLLPSTLNQWAPGSTALSPTSETGLLSPVLPTESPQPAVSRKPLAVPKDGKLVENQPGQGDAGLSTGNSFELPASEVLPVEMPTTADENEPPALPRKSSGRIPRVASAQFNNHAPSALDYDDNVPYADVLGIVQAESQSPPTVQIDESESLGVASQGNSKELAGLGVSHVSFDDRRLSASIRPLPHEDPSENAEQRANRIRSFYREYFDDSKGEHEEYDTGADYYEDYGQEYLNGAAIFDPATGQFIVGNAPYAQPITRRAMTPPPRGPPRFRGSDGPRGPGSQGGRPMRPRVHSSASAGGARGRAPVKKLPPPKALNTLPTPYLLKDDASLFNAGDFAPGNNARDRALGRPESPFMVQRPYTPPTVRAFTPIKSAFKDLTAMPSPHELRKSSTFTALDFAPPPRFRNADTMSDAGSVRSGHSNVSQVGLKSIRNGAYRVSRLPKDRVGTKDELTASLKPSMSMTSPA